MWVLGDDRGHCADLRRLLEVKSIGAHSINQNKQQNPEDQNNRVGESSTGDEGGPSKCYCPRVGLVAYLVEFNGVKYAHTQQSSRPWRLNH